MTRYAVDSERGVIAGAWATGAGNSGFTVAVLPAACETRLALQAAGELNSLSQSLWWIYTHPAGAVPGGAGLDGEGWQREQERRSFRQVLPAIDDPCSPLEVLAATVAAAKSQCAAATAAVSEGRLPDLPSLLAGITHATETAEAADPGNAELVDALLSRIRSTPLDPARPAPSLLEALLAGIRACALLYRDYEADLADGDVGSGGNGDGSGDGSGSAGSTSNYWTLGEVSSASASAPSAAFIAAVRTQAGMAAGQL